MSYVKTIVAIAIILSFTIPGNTQQGRKNTIAENETNKTETAKTKTAPSTKAKNSTKTKTKIAKDSYVIGSGDVLRLDTWKEPDFSREEVLVRTDGFISFPILNDVRAAGLTPTELKKSLETRT